MVVTPADPAAFIAALHAQGDVQGAGSYGRSATGALRTDESVAVSDPSSAPNHSYFYGRDALVDEIDPTGGPA